MYDKGKKHIKIYFHTLGCRLNQAEAERMAQGFILAGHEVVDDERSADIRVVNTCTVTDEAGKKSRRAARPMRHGQKVVVTGCHSEVTPDAFTQAELIVSNVDKERLVGLTLEKFGMDGLSLGMDYKPLGRLPIYPLILDHTRAFVKIQDGCNLRCSFCLTTIARGASQSRQANEIIGEIQGLAQKGCQEVVLTGVHGGAYGDGATDLGLLLERILEETPIPRFRLSSLEPWNFKYSWMTLWTDYKPRLCRHLHMSLQSGSDSVLRRMRRSYDVNIYAEKIDALYKGIPGIAITTDIIVGFPGETNDEHGESIEFIKQMNYAGAHIFTFSPRPGTDAATMSDQIPRDVKQHRYKEVKATTDLLAATYRKSMVGNMLPVLWERQEANSLFSGLSDNYMRVQTQNARLNTISSVKIDTIEGNNLRTNI